MKKSQQTNLNRLKWTDEQSLIFEFSNKKKLSFEENLNEF